jgi:hypothetical protein
MPAKIRKTKSGKYQVSTPEGVTAKSTIKANAEAQANLLRGVAHGWKPSSKNKSRK